MSDSTLDKARREINEIDKKMAELFIQRMHAVKEVAKYKMDRGLNVLDSKRESEVISRNASLVEDDTLREFYVEFIKSNMSISRAYQERLMNCLKVANLGTESDYTSSKNNPSAEKN